VWETVDRPALAAAIAQHVPGARVLIQVDVAPGPGRSGCRPDAVAALVEGARAGGLVVDGLMTIGPHGTADEVRQAFRQVADLARRFDLADVSMGMSDDYEIAVAEGATIVRLGTA